MKVRALNPKKVLNKAFLKVKTSRSEIEKFKTNLITLLNRINDNESEEFHKNLVIDFLKKTYYDSNHFINTKGRTDLVIHNGNDAKSSVGVIIETKKPSNKTEMISTNNLNAKAFYELVLYYLRERITLKNLEVKHLIITNINEWFIFDATNFDRLFAQNKNFVKQFIDFEDGRLADTKTDFFYKQIAEPYIKSIHSEIEYTHFNLQDYQKPLRNTDKADDTTLVILFKLLSPEHLLKLPFANDSNSLDKRFYSELLHIIGLTETKEGNKKVIGRNKEGERNTGSILENTIIQLDTLDKLSRLKKPNQFGDTTQERLFNVALELTITWINRILFLKLLEAQLINYHKGDKSYAFLNIEKINTYDDLNNLFFQVLARNYYERDEEVKTKFEKVPYLNSSLFEPTELEQDTLFISNLSDNKTIPIFSQTVLKDQQGKKRTGNISTLKYLFEFLDAYDFGAEGGEDIQEDNKTLINASVLGLIFEKINGYKDGSFFTPGFITMYMCRETIRKAVIQKFNEAAHTLLQQRQSYGKSPLERGFRGVSKHLPNPPQGGDFEENPTQNEDFEESSQQRGNAKEYSAQDKNWKDKIIPYNPNLKELARKLRNNSTKSEILLWQQLKGKFEGKYDFHRQKPLDNYIADFYCRELRLVIEVDGETHNWEETQQKDFEKEKRLNELGLNVLRFPDSDIFNHLDTTIELISKYIEGFEKGDLSFFSYEDSPLNPHTGIIIENEKPANTLPQKDLFKTLDDIYEQIGEDRLFTRDQANQIVNSIKICDPAVGSGHFLVSALNEIIAIKNDLKILQDRNGRRLKEYHVEVINDELIVTDEDGELFEYNPKDPESQRVQEALFHEKQTIIENCLFGVDINPNSVKICRLRLWIELLKNAYYEHLPNPPQGGNYWGNSPQGGTSHNTSLLIGNTHNTPHLRGDTHNTPLLRADSHNTPLLRGAGGVLQTLPNIDINIKCGNSLVSRFALDADLKQALKNSKWTIEGYRNAVAAYRNAQNKEQKRAMEQLIADIKSDFRSEISQNDPKVKKLRKLQGELYQMTNQGQLFEMSPKEKAQWNKKLQQLTEEIKKLETEIEEIKANKIFENAFEWRFEFPEVLNNDGDFVGFDVVIGNPPYINFANLPDIERDYYSEFELYKNKTDLYAFFVGLGAKIKKQNGFICFIIPHTWISTISFFPLRKLLIEKLNLVSIVELDFGVFKDAYVKTVIIQTDIKPNNKIELLDEKFYLKAEIPINTIRKDEELKINLTWTPTKYNIFNKIKTDAKKLGEIVHFSRGIKTSNDKRFLFKENKGEDFYKVVRGRNIKAYKIDYDNEYIWYRPDLMKEKVGSLPHTKELFLTNEKIITQRHNYPKLKKNGTDLVYL